MSGGFANPRPGLAISVGTGLVSDGTVVFSNSNNVTFGMQTSASSYVITMSVTGVGLTAAIRGLSVSGGQAVDGGVSFANGGGISFGLNGQTITAVPRKISGWDNARVLTIATSASALSVALARESIFLPIDATALGLRLSLSSPTNGSQGTFTIVFGAYSFSVSTASLISSTSYTHSFTSGTDETASTQYAGVSGGRFCIMPLGSTWVLTPADYYFAYSTAISGVAGSIASMSLIANRLFAIGNPLQLPGGGARSACFNHGRFSATTAALPNSIQLSDVVQTWTNAQSGAFQPAVTLLGTF